MSTETVYVALLDEGVDSWRPVTAEPLGAGRFRLIGPIPEEEAWEFQPGDVVLCRDHVFAEGKRGLLAYKLGDA